MKSFLICAAFLVSYVVIHTSDVRAADTLVVAADGAYKPGIAKSWTGTGSIVTFVLAEGANGEEISATLRDRLANAKVEFADGKLTISGLPMAGLLDQLSALNLTGDSDPLAVLAGLGGGGVQGTAGPEGGGSIRASKPTALPPGIAAAMAAETAAAPPAAPAVRQPEERFECDVVDVKRGAFPVVSLKLRVRVAPADAKLSPTFKVGMPLELPVNVTGAAGASFDPTKPDQQRNLAAYYLKKRDRVEIHATALPSGGYEIDWIERK